MIVYEGQYYRVTTYASGGFPFVYWLFELPFVAYGLVLVLVARQAFRGTIPAGTTVLLTVPGITFHLLGPESDFPFLEPMQFVGLGVLTTVAAVTGLVWTSVRERRITGAE